MMKTEHKGKYKYVCDNGGCCFPEKQIGSVEQNFQSTSNTYCLDIKIK